MSDNFYYSQCESFSNNWNQFYPHFRFMQWIRKVFGWKFSMNVTKCEQNSLIVIKAEDNLFYKCIPQYLYKCQYVQYTYFIGQIHVKRWCYYIPKKYQVETWRACNFIRNLKRNFPGQLLFAVILRVGWLVLFVSTFLIRFP